MLRQADDGTFYYGSPTPPPVEDAGTLLRADREDLEIVLDALDEYGDQGETVESARDRLRAALDDRSQVSA